VAAAGHDDFRPTASWHNLRLRSELLREVRRFFHGRGFLEVETPLLSADTVVDRHLDPFPVVVADHQAGSGSGRTCWLQTSPEFCMKRLVAAGARAIYQVTRSFRQGEAGPLHNPEFTIVEWYRAGDDMAAGIQLLDELSQTLLARGPAERIGYGEAFGRYVGLDPHQAGCDELAAKARELGTAIPASLRPDDRDGWLDLLLVERVAPRLGTQRPSILYDYPASQAALAQIRPGPPPVAERFELYLSGIELANGYHELIDAQELRRRNARANAQRRTDGKSDLPCESRLLAAMEAGLADSTGVALGFDRVVMLAAGAERLEEVMAFPFCRA
jgi:lysyl-tRNA synthetase class 2